MFVLLAAFPFCAEAKKCDLQGQAVCISANAKVARELKENHAVEVVECVSKFYWTRDKSEPGRYFESIDGQVSKRIKDGNQKIDVGSRGVIQSDKLSRNKKD